MPKLLIYFMRYSPFVAALWVAYNRPQDWWMIVIAVLFGIFTMNIQFKTRAAPDPNRPKDRQRTEAILKSVGYGKQFFFWYCEHCYANHQLKEMDPIGKKVKCRKCGTKHEITSCKF